MLWADFFFNISQTFLLSAIYLYFVKPGEIDFNNPPILARMIISINGVPLRTQGKVPNQRNSGIFMHLYEM